MKNGTRIKVIGIGGGGSNAVDRMIQVGIAGVEFIAANTDAQALYLSEAPCKILLGPDCARGLGTGGDPALGAQATEESRDDLVQALRGAEIIFIAAGLGGGTGSGGAPLVAEIAHQEGALSIVVVTKPFAFEGKLRMEVAQEALEALRERADAVIAIPNDRLVELIDATISLDIAFRIADDVLRQGVQGISELVTSPGLINLDFAHIKSILCDAGVALMSIGHGQGEDRAVAAAEAAVISPLTDIRSIAGAKGLLINVTGGNDLTLWDVDQAVEAIAQAAHPGANIFVGATVDPKLTGRIQVTLIAVGMEGDEWAYEPLQILVDEKRGSSPWFVETSELVEPATHRPFVTETDLDIPAFIRRRRAGSWFKE
ncbi:MAG: cell division protein FtsZ [Anaerolineae bacterium]